MDSGNLNKLVTNYPVELSEEEISNLSKTLAPVIAACDVSGKVYTGTDFVNINNTTNEIGLTEEAKTKLNQPIPTKVSDLTDSASYQTTSGMKDYLTKTSASENLAPLSVTADIESLKNTSGDFSLYYKKTETSSKDELSSEFIKYVTTTEFNSVTEDVSTLKSTSSEWNKVSDKLDTTAFSTISGDFLTDAPDNMATTGDVAELAKTISETYQVKGDYLTTAESANFYPSNNPSGFITGVDLSNYYNRTETSSKDELDTAFGSKQDNLTKEQLSAISSVSSIKGTVLTGDSNIRATSAEYGNNIKWTLELTAKPVVTDTTLSGYDGIVATKDSSVSSQWNVGIAQAYKEQIESVSSKLTQDIADTLYAQISVTDDVETLKSASAGWNEVSAISRIDSVLENKKDKQTELTFDGSSIKTVKKITQDVNGELHVEFENIDYPDYNISSSDDSINVSTSEGVTDLTLPSDVVRDSNYVHIEGATEVPLMDGITSVGLSTKYAREDHIHPTDTSREAIANKTTVILGTSDIKYPTDKAVAEFVNSSIATNTANYISNNGVPFTSVEQLNAYTGTVTNNDYAFVTGIDSEGNTYYDRYKATVNDSSITWALEYRLNNSTFTEAQWTAINSGITSALVAKIHDHSNKDVLDGITSTDVANWNNKIDKQTIGGASEPVYLENGIAKVATNVATKDELATKQNSLIAGDNVTISENTISSNQVFVATYGTTTFQEIKDAYEVGKICICKNAELIGTLYEISNSVIRFQYTKPNQGYIVSYSVSNNNIWTYNELSIQSKLTFDTTPTEGSSNPVTSDGIKKAIDVVNTDIVNLNQSVDDVKTDLNNLTDTVNNHTTQIGGLQTDVESIELSLANKKDKQTELNFNGSATKTIKSITQNTNGEINVEYEDIDLPQEVPNVEITSDDNSVNVVESTDSQTNTKTFDLSVTESVKSKIKDIKISSDTLVIIGE